MKKLLIAGMACALAACSSKDTGTNPISANCTVGANGTSLVLAPGEVRVLATPTDFACAQLAASAGGGYVFIPANVATTLTKPAVLFKSTSSAAAGVADILNNQLGGSRQPAAGNFGESFELALRQREHALATRPVSGASADRLSGVQAAALPAVGDTLNFTMPNFNNSDLCSNPIAIKAVVEAVGIHGIMVRDVVAAPDTFTSADYGVMSTEFDNYIYPTDTSYFGSPTDRDSNGRVFILFTTQVNKLSSAGSGGFVGGFFWGGDLYPKTACPQSNDAEIFYLLAPDSAGLFGPSGANGVKQPVARARQQSRGTIAHEFMHMINQGVRMGETTNQNLWFESTWLSEAQAHNAEDEVGRAEYGYADNRNLTFADIWADPAKDSAFFYQNMARTRLYFAATKNAGAAWPQVGDSLNFRGAAWTLVKHTEDQYGGANPKVFTRALAAGPDTGIANITKRAGVTWGDLLNSWIVANFADDLGITGLNSVYTYTSYNLRDAMAGQFGGYPLNVRLLSNNDSQPIPTLYMSSGVYFLFDPAPLPATAFSLLNSTGSTVANFSGAELIVLRTN